MTELSHLLAQQGPINQGRIGPVVLTEEFFAGCSLLPTRVFQQRFFGKEEPELQEAESHFHFGRKALASTQVGFMRDAEPILFSQLYDHYVQRRILRAVSAVAPIVGCDGKPHIVTIIPYHNETLIDVLGGQDYLFSLSTNYIARTRLCV